MPFKKGQSGNPAGRIKGEPTKSTKRFKEALNELLESQADKMVLWLEQIDNPKQRFDVIKDLAEYIHPKLARQEHTGKDGEEIKTLSEVRITFVDSGHENSEGV